MTSRPVDGARRRYLCRFIAANRSRGPGAYPAPAHAHPRLPRLPARRDRLQRLQRRARGGARARGPRGPPAQPGPRPARPRLGRRRGRLGRRRAGAPRPAASRRAITVYRPDIAGLLPLYVADRYEGIEARPFQDLSEAEVDRYLERNVAAVREVAERVRPDVALANHLVMGPVILARALEGLDVPYAVKIHGSALEYTVKRHPTLHAVRARGPRRRRAACSSARATRRRACGRRWATRSCPAARASGRPASTSGRFTPREPAEARAGLERLRERLAARGAGRRRRLLLRAPRRRGGRGARPPSRPRTGSWSSSAS